MSTLPARPSTLLPGSILAVAGLALATSGHGRPAALAAVALVVALGLLLDVDLPWGGQVPLGHAVVIALVVLVAPLEAIAVTLAALVAVSLLRRPRDLAVVAAGTAAAAATKAGLDLGLDPGSGDVARLVEVALVGAAFLAVDHVLVRRRLAEVAPLDVTLLCAAALLAVAYQESPALSLIAVVPLLVTKYSFGRFTEARRTYEQTTQALSLLPEVAGLTPLGHGERTAVYAAALADELDFDAVAVDRIATGARLHHIGHISLHEPEERTGPVDPAELARVSNELLRETGFLADVADLVEQVQAGPAKGPLSLEAAVIRVCSTLDDLAELENDSTRHDPFAATLVRHPDGLERTAAIALLRLHDRRAGIVEEARAASRILALVAAGGGHDGPDDHGGHAAGGEPGHDCR
ncbi:MAG TPA: hypothetical protein VM933_02035 [Acidimicrobiales bacterium]|nr:hypothetical protein [Acidimicrobiales bacterium]